MFRNTDMRQRGFSLIELLIVVAIISVLVTLGMLQFNSYTVKANIEGDTRAMYADIMEARSQAIMQKVDRSFSAMPTGYAIYPTRTGSGVAILQKTLKYPLISDSPLIVSYDTQGMANLKKMICVGQSGNPADIDAILITESIIQMGKWNGSCDSAHFTAK